MVVRVNGKEETLSREMTILDFLLSKGLEPNNIIVEHNEVIVKKEQWSQILLQHQDQLELFRFVGGG